MHIITKNNISVTCSFIVHKIVIINSKNDFYAYMYIYLLFYTNKQTIMSFDNVVMSARYRKNIFIQVLKREFPSHDHDAGEGKPTARSV